MENCKDGQGKGKICRRMKKNGCKNQEYGKKNCRKTCDMCGKNISIRKSHFVISIQFQFFNNNVYIFFL